MGQSFCSELARDDDLHCNFWLFGYANLGPLKTHHCRANAPNLTCCTEMGCWRRVAPAIVVEVFLPACTHASFAPCGIGILSQSARIPFAMRSMDKQSLRQHGPPKQVAPLPLPMPSEGSGAQQSTLGSLSFPAEPDWSGPAPQGTAIIVESSEVSPHCFLVCVSCGRERSLLLPMPADDFQAAMGSFASSHRACQI